MSEEDLKLQEVTSLCESLRPTQTVMTSYQQVSVQLMIQYFALFPVHELLHFTFVVLRLCKIHTLHSDDHELLYLSY